MYLIHAYFGIDEDEVWGIIKYQLQTFYGLIVSSIKSMDPELKKEIIDEVIEENSYLDFVTKELKLLKDIY